MRSRVAVAVAVALVAFAVPAAASAHPGVYTVTQKVAGAGCIFPTTGCLTDQIQYAVANDGWALGFTETNNLPPGGGLINYKRMPGTRRAPKTPEEKRTYADAQTNLQAHATCSTPALDDGARILAWQGNDPFFNYVPFQSTSAGLGDEPSEWIPVVKQAAGVDLTGLSAAQAQAACTGLGGTYRPADQPASITTAMISAAVSPLQSQIGSLQVQVSTLQAAKAASDAALNRPLALTLSAKTFDTGVAMVTGVPGTSVKVRMLLSSADAKRLKRSRTLASRTKTLGSQGAELFTLTPAKKLRRAVKVTIEAVGAGKTLTAKGKLS
jgi:hypothetical protein